MELLFQAGAGASLQVFLERLSDFAVKEFGQISDVEGEIRKLRRTLLRIQGLVDDIDRQHLISYEEAWQAWLQDVTTLTFDAEDLLDKIDLDLMRLNSDNATHTQVCNADSKINRCSLKLIKKKNRHLYQ